MTCARCGAETSDQPTDAPLPPGGPLSSQGNWCIECERTYDTWSRQYAADLVWQLFAGATVVTGFGLLIPLLGVPWIVAASGIFVGFGTFIGLNRLNRRRRRAQYLVTGHMPRAYLPPGKPT